MIRRTIEVTKDFFTSHPCCFPLAEASLNAHTFAKLLDGQDWNGEMRIHNVSKQVFEVLQTQAAQRKIVNKSDKRTIGTF